MNIEGLNFTNNLKVSNPISKHNKKHNPSFSGHILTQDEHGNNVYVFNFPNAPKNTKLELAIMTKDHNGDFTVSQAQMVKSFPEGFSTLVLSAEELNMSDDSILGYQFNVNGKIVKDNGLVGNGGYTLATPTWRSNSSVPRQMEHILIDSFNIKDFSKRAKRNHFNVMGGDLKSLNDKVQELADFGVRNVLGTPIFGQDNKSSHGYWTTNAYQITNNLGTKADFNNLMLNLYKHGMGWTADGAFVNEGLEGIHIKDMMTWGKDSPFLEMFETKDIGNEPFKFGVLPKQEDIYKHTHIKLVNAPYKILFEKTAEGYKEKEVKSASYDSTKPTYIQVFDDRLASEKQMNSDSTFNVYDKKDTGDNFEIANYKDSVQAYNFRVNPNEVRDNYKKYKEVKSGAKDVEFKNLLTDWSNFKLTSSNKDGGVSLWVGNGDIAKKRFFIPESTLTDSKITPKQKASMLASQYQVQDDITQVGKFWTGEVSRTLTEYTARELATKFKTVNDYEVAIKELINEKKLHKDALAVTQKGTDGSPLANILKFNIFDEREYALKPVKMASSITDGLMSFPFDAIEFSPDLAGIFAYPSIKNMAVSEDTVGMSRYDMYKMGDSYYNKMPEKFREIYKTMDGVIAGEMSDQAKNIMTELEGKTNLKYFGPDGNLNEQGKEIYTLIAPDIAKFLVVSALAPNVSPKDNEEMLDYDVKELIKTDLNSLNLQYEVSPEDVAKRLISKIKDGVKTLPENKKNDFVNLLYKRIKNIDSNAVNVAKLIVEKTESGLDWRIDAAKDVGDWDAVDVEAYDWQTNIDSILGFWNKFNKSVRTNNPHSFIIGELTNINNDSLHKSQFTLKTGFSTISDYESFYSSLPAFFGQNDEGKHFPNIAGDVKSKLEDYFKLGFADDVNFAHRFVGNHDKPRILHLLAMDVAAFNDSKGKGKASAMGDTLQRGFYGSEEFIKLDDSLKNSIRSAIAKLADGRYTYKGQEKTFDNENFGVRPFDYNIDSVFEQACAGDPAFEAFVSKPENQSTVKKIKANTLKAILEPAMEKYRAMMFLMTALPGSLTNYAGDEFGMTGWETAFKNEKQENRNAVRWDWLYDDDYKFIKDYKNRLGDIMKIRNKQGASALVNGALVSMADQNIKGGGTAGAFYRYNDKTDAIVVFHNKGYTAEQHSKGQDAFVTHIDLGGLPNGLPVGTIYVDALNPESKFKVTSAYSINKIDGNGKNEGEINLGNSGLILLREKDFNGKLCSFKGLPQNPNIKLANTKYDFSYMAK